MTFQINNEIWHIHFVSPGHHKIIRDDGSVSIGSCDDETKTIYIDDTLPDELMRKVLCHEITHAAMFSYDVGVDATQEEVIADLIATYGDEIIHITNKIFNKLKGRYY